MPQAFAIAERCLKGSSSPTVMIAVAIMTVIITKQAK